MIMTKIRMQTFEGNSLPGGGDDAGDDGDVVDGDDDDDHSIKTFERNPLPVGGDDAGLLENVGGGAADLVPVPGQVLDMCN